MPFAALYRHTTPGVNTIATEPGIVADSNPPLQEVAVPKDKRPSAKVASDASKILRSPFSSKKDKELSGSILANREPKKKGK